jgi:hypothetical protein
MFLYSDWMKNDYFYEAQLVTMKVVYAQVSQYHRGVILKNYNNQIISVLSIVDFVQSVLINIYKRKSYFNDISDNNL